MCRSVRGTYLNKVGLFTIELTLLSGKQNVLLIIFFPFFTSSYKLEILKVQCTEFKLSFGLIFPLIHYASFIKCYLIILVFSRKYQCEKKLRALQRSN